MPASHDQCYVFFKGDGIMDAIREYLLSVTAAAILCSVVRRMLNKKKTAGMIGKLLTGLFMIYTVLSPLVGVSFGSVEDLTDLYREDAHAAVARGENLTAQSLRESIKDRLEAYVLEKADGMGVQVRVNILLSDDLYPVPEKVYISGQVAPYAKNRLKQIIREDLGVSEEDQIWT